MRLIPCTTLVLAVATLGFAHGAARGSDAETPAERAIADARAAIADAPTNIEAHNALAWALARRARETADPSWYDKSDAVLARSLELAPGHFEAQKLRVWNQLGRHEFPAALAGAKALNERAKDDVLVYGLLVDANVELGDYAAAEEAAQWMLNLRPGTPAAMTRVSYLRELFGDLEGAMQAMQMAFDSTRPTEREDRAWMLTHLAHLELERGRATQGLALANRALEEFPDYHYALAEAARAEQLAGEHGRAVELLRKRYEVAGHPENLYALACGLAKAGQQAEAAEGFAAFEAAALGESMNEDNANLQLVEYWLDQCEDGARHARALELTRARMAVRQDLATLEAHAWALFRTGDVAEAKAVVERAMAVGSVNATLRHRAGVILAAAGEVAAARVQMETAYTQSPRSEAGRAAWAWLVAQE